MRVVTSSWNSETLCLKGHPFSRLGLTLFLWVFLFSFGEKKLYKSPKKKIQSKQKTTLPKIFFTVALKNILLKSFQRLRWPLLDFPWLKPLKSSRQQIQYKTSHASVKKLTLCDCACMLLPTYEKKKKKERKNFIKWRLQPRKEWHKESVENTYKQPLAISSTDWGGPYHI